MSTTIHQEDGYVVLEIVPDNTRLIAALQKAAAALARLAARHKARDKRLSEIRSAYRGRRRSHHRRNR